MRKYFLHLTITLILAFLSINAKAQTNYLGQFVNDNWLNNFYNSYEISDGAFDRQEKFYPNVKFKGYIDSEKRVFVTIETSNTGRIDFIGYDYKNMPSSDAIISSAEAILSSNRASITSDKSTDTSLAIQAKLPNGTYREIFINASWSYNGFGQFFFRNYTIRFIGR